MNRNGKLLNRIDPATQSGIEIGALDKPIVTEEQGNIVFVDYASTEHLRDRFKDDPNVDTDKIVNVSYIWGEQSLKEIVGPERVFDYIIASHVIEHVPDLITWLKELSAILKPSGIVSLAIPDKRYTFDVMRQTTPSADLIDAYLRRLRKPSLKHIFDHFSLQVDANAHELWAATQASAALPKTNSDQFALWACEEEAIEKGKYVDSHCWVFTPYSFFENLKTLVNLDLFDFEIADYFETEYGQHEFFVTLQKLDPSMEGDEKRDRQLASIPRMKESSDGRDLQLEISRLEAELHAMKKSHSWRITAPIRGLTMLARNMARSPKLNFLRRAIRRN